MFVTGEVNGQPVKKAEHNRSVKNNDQRTKNGDGNCRALSPRQTGSQIALTIVVHEGLTVVGRG
jgi:hypothetical protein